MDQQHFLQGPQSREKDGDYPVRHASPPLGSKSGRDDAILDSLEIQPDVFFKSSLSGKVAIETKIPKPDTDSSDIIFTMVQVS